MNKILQVVLTMLISVLAVYLGYSYYIHYTQDILDESSHANINEVITKHFHLDLEVDFKQKILIGSNTLTFESKVNNLKKVILDAHYLDIQKVVGPDNKLLNFKHVSPPEKTKDLGQYLIIYLENPLEWSTVFNITIYYKTTEKQTAVSWLEPEQTSGGKHPYLYSQCEAIYCRQLAPLQDTPSIKATYTARIKTPRVLKAFLSANQTTYYEDETSRYTLFRMDIAIPSYLFAIVVGKLEQKSVGKRTAIITEAEQLADCVKELEDLEIMINQLEDYIRQPYIWGSYKIVVLPPSFPVGGMENPLLTFASPSIIVGDKSNVAVAIHEIAHSWTGNLVTNQNWKNFWLNEGFTRFLERKGAEAYIGKEYVLLDEVASYPEFLASIKSFGSDDSFASLRPKFNGRSPDDAFSEIPYEKGYYLLKYIESLVGTENFRGILSHWIAKYAQDTATTSDFKNHLRFEMYKRLGLKGLYQYYTKINWRQWITKPGEPPITLISESPLVDEAKKLAQDYIALGGDSSPSDYQNFRKLYLKAQVIFLDELIKNKNKINIKLVKRIQSDFPDIFANIKQCELMMRFLRLCIITQYTETNPLLTQYLGSVGRMRYVTPVYVQLLESGQKALAQEIYTLHKPFYHPSARRVIENTIAK